MKMKATAPRRGAVADDAAMILAGGSSVMSCACGCGRRDWQRPQINARTAWIAMQGSPRVPARIRHPRERELTPDDFS